jgi:hypothetical protein
MSATDFSFAFRNLFILPITGLSLMVGKKKSDSMAFEVVVVLAIVFMVSVTGLVLTSYENKGAGSISSGDAMTGFVVSEATEEPESSFLDIGVSDIIIDPKSPIIGEMFTVSVEITNEGKAEINTPFYIAVELSQPGMSSEPLVLQGVVPKIMAPGEKITLPFKIAAIVVEGPLRVLASADSTAKLLDQNPSNNQRTKTFIVAE